MKIGILTQYYLPEAAAPARRLSSLADRLVRRGHQVHVIAAVPNYPLGRTYPGYGGLFSREHQDGISITRTYVYPTISIKALPRLTNYFSFVFTSMIGGIIRLPQLDYLLSQSPSMFLGISGYVLSRLKGARWILNVSDIWPDSAVRVGVVKDGMRLRLARALEVFYYRKAWLVTGQSKEIVQHISARSPGTATYYLPNGVDTDRFSPERRSEALRCELADGSECIAIYAGLHGLAQGLEQVLRAAARLQDLKHLSIVFVGDGTEKRRLVQQALSMGLRNVRFMAPFPHETMPGVLASADIALVALKDHLPGSVPSKIYEAMGSGLPLVIAAAGEAADTVEEAKAGVAVSPGDADGLASAIRGLAVDVDRRERLGLSGRQAAVAQFDRRPIGDEFINFLESRL